jgi:hypothetical protein
MISMHLELCISNMIIIVVICLFNLCANVVLNIAVLGAESSSFFIKISHVFKCGYDMFIIVFPSTSFIGFVTDEEVKQRELKLREALRNDREFRIKEGASVEIAQVRSLLKC